MVPEKFRRQLRQEAEKWWTEGLIDAALYEQLANRYQLHDLERDASHRFIAILMSLGGILIGLAAITFVAANWQMWSRGVKVLLLLSLFVGVTATGFYLWRRPASLKGQQRLGHGLLLLGALLLGANLALMSQMFHQSGNSYELFLVWGLGVIAMAYSLRLTSLGVLAWILITIGYLLGWFSDSLEQLSIWQLLVRHMPIVAAGLFIPLAYWCRSKVIFGLGATLVATSLSLNFFSSPTGWSAAVAFGLPPALLWSYNSRIWRSTQTPDPFQPTARSLAIWCFSISFFLFAFRGSWNSSATAMAEIDWHLWIDVVLLTVVAGLGWLQLRQSWRGWRKQERAIHSGIVAVLVLITALALIWDSISPLGGLGVLLFNLLLVLLAIGLIRDGLALGERGTFWGGMVLLVLDIICRMLEYNTGLLLKSVVFAICGVGIIAAGLWFERNAKPHPSQSLPQSSQEDV